MKNQGEVGGRIEYSEAFASRMLTERSSAVSFNVASKCVLTHIVRMREST